MTIHLELAVLWNRENTYFFNNRRKEKTNTDKKKKKRKAVRMSFINDEHLINVLYLLAWIVYFWVCSLARKAWWPTGLFLMSSTSHPEHVCLSLRLSGRSCHRGDSCSHSQVPQWQSWTEASFYLSKHNQNQDCSHSLDTHDMEVYIKLTTGSVVLCLF